METQDITTYYETDHDRLDGLFKSYQQLKRSDLPKAKECFRQFKFGLQRHIIWEEEILFPFFERKTGLAERGPTSIMRAEHRQIETHLEAIHQKVRAQDPNTENEEQLLLSVLSVHNIKEERILYPAIERSVSDQERTTIFKTMQSIPPERYNTCCRPEPERK